MLATITRSSLVRGRGYVNYNSANFFCREKIDVRFAPTWEKVSASMFGPVDKYKKDLVLKINLKLWGAWQNLGILFPSYIMDPIPGTSIFGSSDVPLYIQGDNGDYITYTNAQITKVSDLYLGVDNEIFAADVEFTALIGNSNNPEDSGAYHTRGTNAYSDATAAFSKTNFKRVRFLASWGSIAGFSNADSGTPITPQKGVKVSWAADLKPVTVDGLGTRDMSIGDDGVIAQAKMIPIGPTIAQLKANSQEETQMGTLGSALSADLTITGNGGDPVIVLKNAYLMDNGLVFDAVDLRVGEATWETTRGFSGGAPAIVSSVS
jgi:hypothetical protein